MLKRVLRGSITRAKDWLFDGGQPLLADPRYAESLALYHRLTPELYQHCYAWGVVRGIVTAKALEMPRVSLVEFGVAGGNGLVAIERMAVRLEEYCGIGIDVHGFDMSTGLPAPTSKYDLPYMYSPGQFTMDVEALKQRLQKAKLHLGLVQDTVKGFIEDEPSPIAFVSFDMDYYSSTMAAFQVFEASPSILMPRVHCFFDDVMDCGDFEGERRAILEFNQRHDSRKLSKMHGLRYIAPKRNVNVANYWDKYYMAAIFDHPLFDKYEGHTHLCLELSGS